MENKKKCDYCEYDEHFCNCGLATGHYGDQPAALCDECRYVRIMAYGSPGDEPGLNKKERIEQ